MKFNKFNDKIQLSQIGFGAEWMTEKSQEEVNDIIKHCEENQINLLDCWMADPKIRTLLGNAIKDTRNKWYIQGHIGSTWQNNQYVRTRDMDEVKKAFKDLLERLQTDYIDFGMIHFVDEVSEYQSITNGEFIKYVHQLKNDNIIHHIGLSTHNPEVAKLAAENPEIELLLFSINPAFDMMPSTENIDDYFEKEKYETLNGIQAERQQLYELCKKTNTTITVMKAYAGGRLFKKEESPFGVELTPIQCLEYALTRPAVASVLVGIKTIEELDEAIGYENATDNEKDYTQILKNAPKSSYLGQCTYCGHCAPCPSGINIAMINKFYNLATAHDKIPPSIQEHYKNMEHNANECIECGACMTRCPFGVDIINVMHNAEKLFGQ